MTNATDVQILTRDAVTALAADYQAIRNDVGITDCDDWVKIKVGGYDARDFLDRVLTGNLQQLGENEILHTMALDESGHFLCDILVLGGFEDFVLLTTAAQAAALNTALSARGDDEVEVVDRTAAQCLLRIDGPATADLPMAILGGAVSGLRIMAFAEGELDGHAVTVGRIGIAGEFGFFFMADAACKEALLSAIRAEVPTAHQCKPDIHALLQLETRSFNAAVDRPHGEHPFEAGLHWMVDFHKPEFVGREGLFAGAEQDGLKQMVCVRLDTTAETPARLGEVEAEGQDAAIGYVANAAWSPTLETGICLAYLDKDWAAVGLPVQVRTESGMAPGQVVSAPFFVTRSNAAR